MAVSTSEYKRTFLASEDAVQIREELLRMTADPMYNTQPFYTPLDNNLSFVEKHIRYLSEHPKLSSLEYLSNLRLMTKKR